MTVEIRELSEVEELVSLTELFAVVWGRPGDAPIGSDVLKALANSGNYVTGAFDGERLIGGLVGWFGGVPSRDLHLHSHILGVLSGSDARGVGFDLKQHQRRWTMARQVKVIEWTTDPLVRRNVYFNLAKLGAQAPEYLVNVYGTMRDGINAGEESDRLLIRWQLDTREAESAAAGQPRELEVEGDAMLTVGSAGEPVLKATSAPVIVCQVPDDIVAIRRSDAALGRAWRIALRQALGGALKSGYTIQGATRSGWYVLKA